MLDYNSIVPRQKLLLLYVKDEASLFMSGDEVTGEQLDGGILLDYDEDRQVATVPPGYSYVLATPYSIGCFPDGTQVDLPGLRRGRIVADHDRFVYTNSLIYGSTTGRG
jgi:hypothetical protein